MLLLKSMENRVGNAVDRPLDQDLPRSAPVRHRRGRRRHRSVPPHERRSHLPQRLHVRMRPRLAGQQNNSVRGNNSVKHKKRQRESPSNARLKSARHNRGVKRRSKPLGPHNRSRRNKQGRHRSGLARSSRHRNAPAWSSSVEPRNRNALARPMNSSVPTSAGKQRKGSAQPSARRSSAGVLMSNGARRSRRSKGGWPSTPTPHYAPEAISQWQLGTSSCAKSGRNWPAISMFVCGRYRAQEAATTGVRLLRTSQFGHPYMFHSKGWPFHCQRLASQCPDTLCPLTPCCSRPSSHGRATSVPLAT